MKLCESVMERSNIKYENTWSAHRFDDTFSPECFHSEDKRKDSSSTVFTPEIQVFRLTKMQPTAGSRLWKSPSLPSPSAHYRDDGYSYHYLPSYLTLGRKGSKRITRNEHLSAARFDSENGSESNEMNKIRSILASLDLAKYKRKGNQQPNIQMNAPLRRTVSEQPTVCREDIWKDKCFVDTSPKPMPLCGKEPVTSPKAIAKYASETKVLTNLNKDKESAFNERMLDSKVTSGKIVNTKLKELTERLASSSAPPSPQRTTKLMAPHTAPPSSAVSFWKDPLPPIEQLSFTYDDYEDIRAKQTSTIDQNLDSSTTKFRTLPRVKPPISLIKLRSELKTTTNTCLNKNDRQNKEQVGIKLQEVDTRTNILSNSDKIPVNESSLLRDLKQPSAFPLPSLPKLPLLNIATTCQNPSQRELNEFRHRNESKDFTASEQQINSPHKNSRSVSGEHISGKFDLSTPSSSIRTDNRCSPAYDKQRYVNEGITFLQDVEQDRRSDYTERLSMEEHHTGSSTHKVIQNISNPSGYVHLTSVICEIERDRTKTSTTKKVITGLDYREPLLCERNEVASSAPNVMKTFAEQIENNDKRPRSASVTDAHSSPQQRRYFKKRLRGPYGEMLEQEMSKSKQRPSYDKDLDFLKDLNSVASVKTPYLRSSSQSFDRSSAALLTSAPKRKTSANIPLVEREKTKCLLAPCVASTASEPLLQTNGYTITKTDSPQVSTRWSNSGVGLRSQDEETRALTQFAHQDTRTHVVGELYETEKSYVESLQIVVKKYMKPLKSSEHCGAIESSQVDEIFYQIPEILGQHEVFLDVLKQRLTNWDTKQKIGDVFIDVFTRQSVIDTYTAFINNWKTAKETIKSASLAKPAFAKFLEHTSREHKGKLTLDALLIMPVQRIPRYELLIKELLKHTPVDHPDHHLLLQAQKEVHDLAVNINRLEREALEQEQMMQKLKEIEHLIEGLVDLVHSDRAYIRHDFVCTPGGLGTKKDRCLFLFSDLLLITNLKKKSAPMKKSSIAAGASPSGSLESNKYKLLMKLPLQNVEVTKKIDERSVRRFLKEVSHLEADVAVLGKISDMLGTLSCQHQVLDESVREILSLVSKQLIDKQTTNSQLMALELAVTVQSDVENLTVIFPNPDKRLSWEMSFGEAKENLVAISGKIQPPTFLCSIPIQKTRAGLQVTCAVPSENFPKTKVSSVWICNSDDYVGQICVLNLAKEPSLISCSNVCDSKITCITCVPGIPPSQAQFRRRSTVLSHFTSFKLEKCDVDASKQIKSFQLDSDTSDDEEEEQEEDFIDSAKEDEDFDEGPSTSKIIRDHNQSTMWLGTEDGFIFAYDCSDVWLKGAKLKLKHSAAICDLVYIEGKVFSSLANGDIFIYSRDKESGLWDTYRPQKIQIGTAVAPIAKMTLVGGNVWCASSNNILLLNVDYYGVENTFQVVADSDRPVLTVVASSVGVWVAVHNSPIIRLFHPSSFHKILDVNIAPAVTKMLSACDDIIRQHKSACLRVSSLHICKNILWIGTSAGVLLTMPIPLATVITSSTDLLPSISGVSQGHTGHVRLITSVEISSSLVPQLKDTDKSTEECVLTKTVLKPQWSPTSVLTICAGDGYEDFSCLTLNESAGREDSTNHLLVWKV